MLKDNSTSSKLVIGLTGGIGSGKTIVAKLFANLGIDIIDTDQIAHNIVQPGSDLLHQIVAHFGQQILNVDGSLNRQQMRKIIFQDSHAKHWLEQLLHPIIYRHMYQQIQQATSPYCVVIIPLLIETHIPYPIDKILVIDATEELQIQRTISRDNITTEEVQAIMHAQATREERLKIADDVIDNNQDIAHLEQQVNTLHKKYCKGS